ncbi:hypothetical protein TcWFU_009084 [Taenia crassiceps]|uniref:Uncharacterized protein n=1 Tax=Taenia crassiceps TaxID=6207 RepID=A0ABR4QBH6_9CEST
MRSLQFCLFAVVLILTLHKTWASTYGEDADKATEIMEKILVGKEDPEESKTLESALKISNEDGNIQLKFWFQGDDDSEEEESVFDSDNDNDIHGGDDGDDYERSEGHHNRFSPENRRRSDRRRPHPYDDEEEEEVEEEVDERYAGYRCMRYGCLGGYRRGSYDDDEEYANDLWRDYRRRRGLGRGDPHSRRRPFLGDDEDDDNDEKEQKIDTTMSINECPLLHIELINPTQPTPSPGELETFPRITLSTEGILHFEKRSRTPRRSGARSGARLSRFRTQPITIAEIAEIDGAPNEEKVKTTEGITTAK